MRDCDLCGERYGQEFYAETKDGYFIGHERCMKQIEGMSNKEGEGHDMRLRSGNIGVPARQIQMHMRSKIRAIGIV